MHIGAVARRVGIAPSAIRYYEKSGLLPKPARRSGRRHYGSDTIGRLRIIKLAREAGFTVQETKTFLSGFSATTRPAARWRSLAQKKLQEFDALVRGIEQMKQLLLTSFQCDCISIEDCERTILKLPVTGARVRRAARRGAATRY